MANFEGPAPTGNEFAGASPTASQGLPEAPPLTAERSAQELARLATIITSNSSLNFLEPRVRKCQENGGADLPQLLSFYRLISQALSEELAGQKDRLQVSESALAQAKQTSSQAQMQAALEEASMAVQMVARGESPSPQLALGSGGPPASEEALAKLEQAEKQSERLLQDMNNMRNRAKIDVEVRVFKELEKFSQSLLPALDGFHQAMPTLKVTSDISSVVTGVTMIYETLLDSLAKAGLTKLEVIGKAFDPRFHEAIGEVPSNDYPDEHVYDELQPGYMLGERMIRAAMVRLARNDASLPPAAPRQSAAQGAAPAAAPQESAPQASAAQGAAPQGSAPQGTAPQGSTPQGSAPQGSAPQGSAPQGSTPHGSAPQGATPQGSAPHGSAPHGSAPQPGAPAGYGAPQAAASTMPPSAPSPASGNPVAAPSPVASPAAQAGQPPSPPAAMSGHEETSPGHPNQ